MTASTRSATFAAGSNPTLPVARPPGVTSGDQLWAVHSVFNTSLAAMTAAGWSLFGSIDAEFMCVKVWRRTAGGAEPGTYVFGQGNSGTVHVFALPGASTTARVTFDTTFDTFTDTPGVIPADGSAVEIRVAAAYTYPDTVTWTGPAGYTPRGQVQADDIISSVAATRSTNSSSSAGVKTFTSSPTADRPGVGVSISVGSAVTAPDPEPQSPYSPGVGDALYEYDFHRFLDRSRLGNLDLTGVGFEKRANRLGQINSGPFNGAITITSPEVSNLANLVIPRDPLDLTRGPGVISVDILRGGEPVGEYWIVGATVSKTRRMPPVLTLAGLEIDAYWAYVELQESLGELAGSREDLARELLTHMQAQAHAGLGLVLPEGSSGSSITRPYLGTEVATYGKHLAELTEGQEGIEHCVNILAGPAGLERHVVLGDPLLGDPDAKHSFSESPEGGDILDWSFQINPLRTGDRWRARGGTPEGADDASTVAVPLMSTVHESAPHLLAGWPRIDRTIDRSDVLDSETLEDYAAGWAANSSGAVRIWSVTILAGEHPTINPNCMGDAVGISMINEYFPQVGSGPGYDGRHRMIGIGVEPVGRENGKDEFTLILAEPLEVT